MTEEILPQIYRIEIPLPNNPLKALNSYFIRGRGRNLLIDTGFNRPECRQAMDAGMRELGFTMENTDILVTHIHSDHSGLVHYLATPDTKVFCDHYTASYFVMSHSDQEWSYFADMIRQSGLTDISLFDHPGYRYKTEPITNICAVGDGDTISVGDFNFQCVSTPGHAPDHICLYEKELKLLFSGDHILSKITPNNTLWDSPWAVKRDLLREYLDNLDKIAALQIASALPAHRALIKDCSARIQELKDHHQRRLDDVLEILGNKKMHGTQVASKMKWDMRNQTWEQFSNSQKIFASGEALAHLNHLVVKKILIKELRDGVVYYSLAQ